MGLATELALRERLERAEDAAISQAETVIRLSAEIQDLRRKLNNRRKLSASDAATIRRLYRTTGFSHQDIADMYEVNRATITRIINRVYHKEV